jgi:hypothetical protein
LHGPVIPFKARPRCALSPLRKDDVPFCNYSIFRFVPTDLISLQGVRAELNFDVPRICLYTFACATCEINPRGTYLRRIKSLACFGYPLCLLRGRSRGRQRKYRGAEYKSRLVHKRHYITIGKLSNARINRRAINNEREQSVSVKASESPDALLCKVLDESAARLLVSIRMGMLKCMGR